MEGFFQKVGIYAHEGQKYEPVDSEQLSSYREDIKGQVLEEGLTEVYLLDGVDIEDKPCSCSVFVKIHMNNSD